MNHQFRLMWDHLHIEASSICALACPRCPRAEVPETLLNQQLTLQFFQQQIGSHVISQLRKITFCGNDGDPIYCRDLIDICAWLKTSNRDIAITIITNGHGRPTSWWHDLARVLDVNDEIHWSIDGWDQQSNQQYRVNSRWASILQGIETFSDTNTTTYRVWAAIAFRFNEYHLSDQQQLASQLKFDQYQLTRSTKFGSRYPDSYGEVDLLEPTQKDLVSSSQRFERDRIYLSAKQQPGQLLKEIFWQRARALDSGNKYSGVCLIGNKGVFINSRGELYPCCWTANRYDHNHHWHRLAAKKFNLYHRDLIEIINDDFWHEEFLKFNSLECQTKCTRDKLKDQEHVVEW